MAPTRYVSMEKKAAGKSSLFKFVSLRSPDTVSRRQNDTMFLYHPDVAKSAFSDIGDMNSRADYNRLFDIAKQIGSIRSTEELKEFNKELFDLSDWLPRNKSFLTFENLDVKAAALSNDLAIRLWDNFFALVVTRKSAYLRDAILKFLIADNFVRKYKNPDLIDTDIELNSLGAAKLIIPRAICIFLNTIPPIFLL